MTPHDRAPNGIFCDGLILYTSLERGAIAVKGFWFEPADCRGTSFTRLNALQDQLRAFLALATPGRRLQFQWSCDADYRAELLRYRDDTLKAAHPVARRVREERFTRYWSRMQARELRRERLAVFLSIEITAYAGNFSGRAALRNHYGKVLAELQTQFEEFAGLAAGIFAGEAVVRPMEDGAHAQCLRRFLNPSWTLREETGGAADPALTIQENCWHCDAIGQREGGFVLDGYHHAVLRLARWPQGTRPGIVTHLTGLPFLDYAVTVNVCPAAARHEIQREEKAIERLQGEYAQKPRPSLLVALKKKERKIEALSGGFARPFHVTYVVRVWAASREKLREKVAAVQAAIHAMDGAQYAECALATTAKKLFFASWPGWTHSSYRHGELYAEDTYLADLLPFSATFTGALAQAEALYDGSYHNVVGFSTEASGSPQHLVLLGMTGAGKSEAMRDLLFQTAAHFQYTILVEEGFSYQSFTAAMGETPLVVHPDAPFTLNYFDTQQLPLTQLHLASAVALLSRMIGDPDTAEKLALRQAQLTHYVEALYHETYTTWAERQPEKAAQARRLAYAVHQWRKKLGVGATPLEAYTDLRDRYQVGDDEAQAYLAEPTESDLSRFAGDPTTTRSVMQIACSFFTPEEFPTHSQLVERISKGRSPEHAAADLDRMATLLRAWCVSGQYGRIFDGVTNVSLQRPIVHFELGSIPEQAIELKTAVGLLISGFVRQHILSLPRTIRKRLIFEELARFLDVPGGEKIVAEGFAQLRKHNCWVATIIQQYGRLKSSRVRPIIIGNAKQFLLMRQSDRRDLAELAEDLALPEFAVDAIQRYPMPEQLPHGGRYSSLCYFTPTTQPPQCGTLRHFQPAEDAYAPASTA